MRKGLALVTVLLLLTGCAPVSREPDNLALVRVLGVDGDGQVTLTAVCGSDPQNNVLRGKAVSDSFENARQAVVWSGGEKELSLTGVSYLLVGPDVKLEAILFAILKDADLGASAIVWVAEDGAAEVLGNCNDPAASLELLKMQGVEAPSVAQALAALTTNGRVSIPCLETKEGCMMKKGELKWETGS